MLFSVLNDIGTVAFAVSGTLTAIEKRMDAFGIFIIAVVTAFGGGTLRDILIGHFPVTWLTDLWGIYVVIASIFATILLRKQLHRLRLSLILSDTIGIGVFTLIGIQKGLVVHLHPFVCVLLGTITACFGGVIRDILVNDIPVVFHKEIYATACITGGAVFFLGACIGVPNELLSFATILTVMLVRLLAVYFKWSLPQIKV